MKKPIISLLACTFALCSCMPKKAIIVEEIPIGPTEATEEALATAPTPPSAPAPKSAPAPLPDAAGDEGFRLPDMLAMPDEDQLKSTPGAGSGNGDGTVIAQPPKE
ncbi:MAG: hypothetical protein ABJQ29_12255 [Luteolibacter sp.]